MQTLKIDVCGTEYTVLIGKREELDLLPDHCGDCRSYGKKQIQICTDQFEDEKDNRELMKEVVCHELSHAFLYESGLVHYSEDEVLVEWLSVMCQKLCFKAIEVSTEMGLYS